MLKLKVVMPLILDETVSVSVVVAICPAVSVTPSWFQVKVMGPLAFVGVHVFVVMFNFICAVPVFFTYTVWVTVLLGEIEPQLMDVQFVVQALSE
jgi:hypothetical protein